MCNCEVREVEGSVEDSGGGWCDGAVLSDLSRMKSGIPRDCVAKIFCQKVARVIGSVYMYRTSTTLEISS